MLHEGMDTIYHGEHIRDDGGGELEIILPVYHFVQPQREAAAA